MVTLTSVCLQRWLRTAAKCNFAREGVTEAAQRLQAAGAIRYSRDAITIVDRSILEGRVCECYEVVNAEYTRLLRDVQIPRATLSDGARH